MSDCSPRKYSLTSNGRFPCKDCKKRYLGCHDSCEEYQDAKKENEEYKKIVKNKRDAELEVVCYEVDRSRRIKKVTDRLKKYGG